MNNPADTVALAALGNILTVREFRVLCVTVEDCFHIPVTNAIGVLAHETASIGGVSVADSQVTFHRTVDGIPKEDKPHAVPHHGHWHVVGLRPGLSGTCVAIIVKVAPNKKLTLYTDIPTHSGITVAQIEEQACTEIARRNYAAA